MAVRVHCSICDKFIKNVGNHDFQKLNGEEICEKCGKKVNGVYKELDDMVKKFKTDLEVYHNRMDKVYKTLGAIHERYANDIQGFYTTRGAALDDRMKDILRSD